MFDIDKDLVVLHENELAEGGFHSNTYIIKTENGHFLIDPSYPIEKLPEEVKSWCTEIKWLSITHGHFDHIHNADLWRKITGAPLYIHTEDAEYLTRPEFNLSSYFMASKTHTPAEHRFTDQHMFKLTNSLSIQSIHTPGHTPGSTCYLLLENNNPIALFTGDTLFANGGYGRYDFPNGDYSVLLQTMHKLKDLGNNWPKSLMVFPGHGQPTTWERILIENPLMKL